MAVDPAIGSARRSFISMIRTISPCSCRTSVIAAVRACRARSVPDARRHFGSGSAPGCDGGRQQLFPFRGAGAPGAEPIYLPALFETLHGPSLRIAKKFRDVLFQQRGI